MPKLTVEGVGTFEVPAGKRLVNALVDECGVDQLPACGGVARPCQHPRARALHAPPRARAPGLPLPPAPCPQGLSSTAP